MFERRGLRRRHLIYYLRVFDRNTDKLFGHLVDVTTNGAMLISESEIDIGAVIQARMVLPEGLEENKEIHFDAHCIWCKKDINPSYYAAGFELQGIEQEDKEMLEYMIDEFGFRD